MIFKKPRPFISGWIFAAMGLATFPAFAFQPPFRREVQMDFRVSIPMRDGLNLSAILYRPREVGGPVSGSSNLDVSRVVLG